MKKVDNNSFLDFLEKDIIKNFYLCDNIVNSGKDGYAIKSIGIYTIDGTPSDDYVVLTENIFDELIIEVKTSTEILISDIFSHIKRVAKNYKKLRIGANSLEFFESTIFKKYFKLQKTYYADFGVFAHFSSADMVEFDIPQNIIVSLENDFSKYSDYDDENWDGLESLIKYKNETDKFFVIKENDEFCKCAIKHSLVICCVYDKKSFIFSLLPLAMASVQFFRVSRSLVDAHSINVL